MVVEALAWALAGLAVKPIPRTIIAANKNEAIFFIKTPPCQKVYHGLNSFDLNIRLHFLYKKTAIVIMFNGVTPGIHGTQ
ncbi:hypothetical protein YK48G_04960 [Lentilactobacillus fungorum]|uniref:Uncharacterized protein n=1 Tax=Lentilactobacillus fungorum TaxID=2201250 RepID=A0ABQ3VXC0_9LACO|nr:hypothetical protein YK48G_04960 [Lentilactobacillus fungorum]